MQFSFDKFNRVDVPRLFLCNPNFVELYAINPSTLPKLSMKFNDISEMEFELYEKDVNGNLVPGYSMMQKNMVVLMDGFGYWVISSTKTVNDGSTEKKTVFCKSYEYNLCQREANIDAGTYNFYNPAPGVVAETLLYKLVEKVPSWTVGNIDASLLGKYRTFDMPDGKSIYAFLTTDVAEAYECIFSFNSTIVDGKIIHRINAKPVTAALVDTEIALRWNNLLKNVEIEEVDDKIVTQFAVYGAGSMSIANINPLGNAQIYRFDKFKYDGTDQWMSEALWAKIESWQNAVDDQMQPHVAGAANTYKDYVTLYNTANYSILASTARKVDAQGYVDSAQNVLDAETPYSLNNNAASTQLDNIYAWVDAQTSSSFKSLFENSTAYPLIALGINGGDVYPAGIAAFAVAITDNADKIICQALANKYAAERIVSLYDADVAAQNVLISGYKTSMETIKDSLDFSTYLNDPDLYAELDKYLFGDTYTNEHFVALSMDAYKESIASTSDENSPYYNDTDALHYYEYIQSITEDLYTEAKHVLERISQHNYTFSLSAVNFLFIKEYEKYIEDFALGCQIHAEIKEDDWVSPIILQVDFDYGKPDDFSLTFGNRFRLQTSEYTIEDLNDSMSRTSGTLTSNFNDLITPKREDFYSEMQAFIDGALNAALNNVVSGDNQQITIDGHGLWARKYDNGADKYTDSQIKMQDDGIFFTRDGWKNCAAAIGKITLGESEYYGIVGEAIVGRLIAGSNLVISNGADESQSTFYVDASGATLKNCKFTSYDLTESKTRVLIDPSSDGVFSISKKVGDTWVPQLYIDDDGNVQLDGQLKTIAGWQNADNSLTGKTSDSSGYYAQIGCGFTPSKTAFAFQAGSFDGSTLTPNFSVNYDGKMIANDAEISGKITSTDADILGLLKVQGNQSEQTNNIYIQGGKIGFSQLNATAFGDSWGVIKCDGLNDQGSAYIDIFGHSIAGIRIGCGTRNHVQYSVLAQSGGVHLYGAVYLDDL